MKLIFCLCLQFWIKDIYTYIFIIILVLKEREMLNYNSYSYNTTAKLMAVCSSKEELSEFKLEKRQIPLVVDDGCPTVSVQLIDLINQHLFLRFFNSRLWHCECVFIILLFFFSFSLLIN